MNITKQKQTHKQREKNRGYLWGGGGKTGERAQEVQTTMYKMNNIQGCIYNTNIL